MERNSKLYQVGRRHWEYRFNPNPTLIWSRIRFPFTKRHWLKWRGEHNPKTLKRERFLADKKPLWWTIGLLFVLILTP
ncbi:MAG: branched-chain amino acid ABC transporter permease, partial [Pseudomonadota bacterium]|nr:branched-chain amino acid ABC transporter permease [Pseudomonadota bacterium]